MRRIAPGLVLLAALGLLGVGSGAREPDRSACGVVGDREHALSPDARRSALVRCTQEGSAWLYVAEAGRERRVLPARFNCCYRPSRPSSSARPRGRRTAAGSRS
jgi:hypothetical protein